MYEDENFWREWASERLAREDWGYKADSIEVKHGQWAHEGLIHMEVEGYKKMPMIYDAETKTSKFDYNYLQQWFMNMPDTFRTDYLELEFYPDHVTIIERLQYQWKSGKPKQLSERLAKDAQHAQRHEQKLKQKEMEQKRK